MAVEATGDDTSIRTGGAAPEAAEASAEAEEAVAVIPQRCTDERPHEPHPVRPRRLAWTPFQCAGRPTDDEIERRMDKAFRPRPQTT